MSQPKIERISVSPTICGGKPCITGTRIRIQDIYIWHELQGLSADDIVSRFPQVTMADVYAALAYYWEHREEIERQMQEEDALVKEMKRKYASPLEEKLGRTDAQEHPLPSR